ncbi:Cupredoxin [Bisporella sp. PMI_857]|nr:Cupredoxin [Bisporella sp. PMI_857]
MISSDSSSTSIHLTASTSTSASAASSYPTTITQSKATHVIDVGTGRGFAYNPSWVNASIGDTVRFNFLGRNHSVTQSDLASPCTSNGGFDTGLNQFNPLNISGKFVVDFQVNVSTPLWFYCKQPGPPSHCGEGMIFAINPGDRFNQFLKNAAAQGQALAILISVLGAIGNASSFSISAIDNALFNSTIRRRYLR